MKVHGYKAFNKNMTNNYGQVFEEGKTYSNEEKPRFGVHGVGFHFCKRLEDTLRYVSGMDDEIKIAEVTGIGDIISREDRYNEYFDLYCTNKIRIDHVLSRQEIIKKALDLPLFQAIRFIQGFNLTEEEVLMFRLKFGDYDLVQKMLSYYQEGQLDVFNEGFHYHK